MTDMHISLISAAVAALLAVWLGMRCGKVRQEEKILHGDGGSARMARRMRAQSNFVEYTPFALVLIVLLDLMDKDGWLLGLSALAFMLGRVLHAIGMDSDHPAWQRIVGIALTLSLLLAWAVAALLVAFGII